MALRENAFSIHLRQQACPCLLDANLTALRDLTRRSKKAPLLDRLVGNGEQPFGHVQHPRSLEANWNVFQKSPS
jgi:hypothetical protein